ncbi:MAG: hypothetical protein AAFX50_21130, partial [Acidobacteriota bacterium]
MPGTAATTWDGSGASGPGCYFLETVAADACGNQTRRLSEVVLDLAPPTVRLTNPVPGPVAASFLEITWTASDDFGFVSSGEPAITFELAYGLGAAPDHWLPLREPLWNTTSLPPGEYSIRLRAFDRAGNASEDRVTVVLDPKDLVTGFEAEPQLFSPGVDGRFDQSTVRYSLARPGRITLDVVVDGSVVRTLLDAERDRGSHLVAWDGRTDAGDIAPDGEYGFRLRGFEVGQSTLAQEELITVTLDATPPAISVERPAVDGFLRTTDETRALVEDERLAEWTVSVAVEAGAPSWEVIARGFGPAVVVPVVRSAGDYLLRLEAQDHAGNRAEVIQRFSVDETPPLIAWSSPSLDAVLGPVGGPVTLSGLAVDDHLSRTVVELGQGPTPSTWQVIAEPAPDASGSFTAAWDLAGVAD